jgi:TRAP-type C4-dicarboxylate transport system substrate-binding protein
MPKFSSSISSLSRRTFLLYAARGLAGLSALGVLAACSKAAPTAGTAAPGAATAGPATGGSTATVTLRFGNTAVQGATLYEASQQFVTKVADKTSGSVKLEYLSGGVLGGDAQLLERSGARLSWHAGRIIR